MGGIGEDFSRVLATEFVLYGLAAFGLAALFWFLVKGE